VFYIFTATLDDCTTWVQPALVAQFALIAVRAFPASDPENRLPIPTGFYMDDTNTFGDCHLSPGCLSPGKGAYEIGIPQALQATGINPVL
jgi:hypothetical protein